MQGQFVYPTNAPNKISKNAPNQIKQINRRAKSLGVSRIIFWTMLTYGRPYVRPGVWPLLLHFTIFYFGNFFTSKKTAVSIWNIYLTFLSTKQLPTTTNWTAHVIPTKSGAADLLAVWHNPSAALFRCKKIWMYFHFYLVIIVPS